MKLHVLGSGTPIPSPHRYGTAFAAELGGRLVMIDCGPAATYKLVRMGFSPVDVSHMFFTHHHDDHNADYPCFLLHRWDQNIRQEENLLHVYGPSGTRELTEDLIGPEGAYRRNIRARLDHHVSQRAWRLKGASEDRRWPEVEVQDVTEGWRRDFGDLRVVSCRAEHVQPHLDSLAWRFETPEGTIVFTGDTEPCAEVIDLAQGADVLVAMCLSLEETLIGRDQTVGVSGTIGAARIAAEAGARHLVAVHQDAEFGRTPGRAEEAIADIARHYDGRIHFASELTSLELL